MLVNVKTKGVCTRSIEFDLEGDIVSQIKFNGGCEGNLKALAKVCDGMTVEQIEEYFKGIRCGGKSTSCSDQLAKAVREAYENSKVRE